MMTVGTSPLRDLGVYDIKDANRTGGGLGKFNLAIDEVAHTALNEGWADMVEGVDQYMGVLSIIIADGNSFLDVPWYEGQTQLNESDIAFLKRQKAVVTIEQPSGFFSALWFEDSDAARAQFDKTVPVFAIPEDWDGESDADGDGEDVIICEGCGRGEGFHYSDCPFLEPLRVG